MKVVEHQVRSVDTIQSIAAKYLYSADRWRDIADFNNLDYPYVSADPTVQKYIKAQGFVSVVRAYATSVLIIPKGTQFMVPAVDGLPARIYESLRPITILAGVSSALVPVQCTVPGFWGNVQGNLITGIVPGSVLQNAFTSITNPDALSNGKILNVRTMGDSLLIPVDSVGNGGATYDNLTSFYNTFFGEDLALGDDGDFMFDGYGSISSVIGVGNLSQAVRDRLTTPKLSLVYHPEYGSTLKQITAQGPSPYLQKWVSLAIVETLLNDERIGAVKVMSLSIVHRELHVVVDVTPVNKSQSVRVSASISNLPFAA